MFENEERDAAMERLEIVGDDRQQIEDNLNNHFEDYQRRNPSLVFEGLSKDSSGERVKVWRFS